MGIMGENKSDEPSDGKLGASKRQLSQEEVPAYPLEQALRVPRAIADNYAYRPTRPMNVAGAMKMSPGSGPFRMLAGAAIAYGLTSGGAYAPEIGITPLGIRIVRPTVEGDELVAKREALLRPKVIGDFLRQYDGAAIPADAIARNVLLERGIPPARVEGVLALILDGAQTVGFIKEISGKKYVDLAGTGSSVVTPSDPSPREPTVAPSIPALRPGSSISTGVAVSPGIHINIEIHIAADSSADTIEEIFKNMRRYVLSGDGAVDKE
jgi:hypothetical protein